MKKKNIKKVVSLFIIIVGAVALISEISSEVKNYYIQSAGLILLMLGLFLVNSKIESKVEPSSDEFFEEE